MKKLSMVAGAAAIFLASSAMAAVPAEADVVVLMDESGSMAGEQAWMQSVIPQLDTGLTAAGVGTSKFGLIGFGSSFNFPTYTRSFTVGGGEFGTAAEYVTAGAGLVASGGTEDGYAAIDMANGYTFGSQAARNYILISDEDRDNTVPSLNYSNMLSSMTSTNTLLNAVVDASFRCGDGSSALGMFGDGTGYQADGAGGYTTCGGATVVSGFGTTIADYVDLAFATGGAAWDLSFLRLGGLYADSFTAAFIDGKIGEIIVQPPPSAIPEPGTYAMMLAGLGLVGAVARRKQRG